MGGTKTDSGNNNSSANNVPPSRRNQTNKFTSVTKDVTNPNDDTAAKLNLFNKGKKGNAKGTLAIINPLLTKSSEVTRNFYTTRVLKGKDLENFKSKSVTEQEAQYKSYLDGRLSGKTDAMGRDTAETMRGIDAKLVGAERVTTAAPTTAPTNAEITQAQSTDMSADQVLLANKKKGRSQTILNTAQGLGSSTANIMKKTLGA